MRSDRRDRAELAPAVVDIVALGDDLLFKDGILDYVLSSHVIEHLFDAIKALREWYRVIKPDGYIFTVERHHGAVILAAKSKVRLIRIGPLNRLDFSDHMQR